MDRPTRWVLLAYRLPREPSTPRIGVWRQLRRLGVGQIADSVVALPLDARTRERFEWLAQDVIDKGGDATVWLAEPGSTAQERALASAMSAAVTAEYAAIIAEVGDRPGQPDHVRRRTIGRLRRELRRIAARDYFPQPIAGRARDAVEALARDLEVAS